MKMVNFLYKLFILLAFLHFAPQFVESGNMIGLVAMGFAALLSHGVTEEWGEK